jgi:hypothetical protein
MTGRHGGRGGARTDPVEVGVRGEVPLPRPPAIPSEAPSVGPPGEWPLVAVVSVCLTGLAVVLSDHFRRGTVLIAGGLLLAAGLRAVLRPSAAGLLVVRSRALDVLTLGVLGVGVLLSALLVPPPS